VGVVVLANSSTMVLDPFGVALMRMLRGESYEFKRKEVAKVAEEVLDRYVGDYQVSPQFSIWLRRDGDHLTAQATGQNRFRIYPSRTRRSCSMPSMPVSPSSFRR
jgi:serine-type D-Ala-D-Ala carboxypeptidase/endopeptidase